MPKQKKESGSLNGLAADRRVLGSANLSRSTLGEVRDARHARGSASACLTR